MKIYMLNGDTHMVPISSSSTGLQLKWAVHKTLKAEVTEGKRLRLIYKGGMLEDSSVLSSIGFVDQCVVHCVLSDIAPPALSTPASTIVSINHPVGGAGASGGTGTSNNTNVDVSNPNQEDGVGLRGFDLLLLYNYTQEEVEGFRSRFAQEIDLTENMLPLLPNESPADRRLRAEVYTPCICDIC